MKKYTIVDTLPGLEDFFNTIKGLSASPPSLYLDLEGGQKPLGRDGSISIISIHVAPSKHTYLIDVHILGEKALTTSSDGVSLKAILEDASIPKAFFDVRNDAEALFGLYNIAVDGIRDVQLMELAARKETRGWLAGLVKCVESDISDAAAKTEWRRIKEQGTSLYRPEKGGKYEIFEERPLKEEIAEYCVGDVALLPELYAVYDCKLKEKRFWQSMVARAARERIKESQSGGYVSQGKEKAKGPWTKKQIQDAAIAWNKVLAQQDGENMCEVDRHKG